jgi:transcriptional regulator with XRE-family HTH domain
MAGDYRAAIAASVRATRAARGMTRREVTERMREMGWDAWHRQTLGNIERGQRRLTADEAFGLAWVMQVPIAALLTPPADFGGGRVATPAGQTVGTADVRNWTGRYAAARWTDGTINQAAVAGSGEGTAGV